MKPIWPLMAAGLLCIWPLSAHAQGYGGVMAPQAGYHAPQGAPPAKGGDMGSPYGGTGANDTTGYTNMMGGDTAEQSFGETEQDAMPDDDKPQHVSSPFVDSFAPKTKGDDDHPGASIYDTVDNNTGTATERRRKAILRKIDAEQRKEQENMKRVNEQHNREVQAFVRKTARDAMRKPHDGDDTGDDEDQVDQDQDQGQDADTSPDAVKQ